MAFAPAANAAPPDPTGSAQATVPPAALSEPTPSDDSEPALSEPTPSNDLEPAQWLPGGSLRLHRDASADDCPSAHSLALAVGAQVRAPRKSPASVVVSVSATRERDYYSAQILVESPTTGMRELRVPGPGCAGLSDALIVALTLIFDEEAALAAAVPTPPPATPAAAHASEPQALAFGIGASLVQALPRRLSGAVNGELEFSNANYSAAAGAFWTPTQHIEFSPGAVDIQLIGGQARMCRFLWHGGAHSPRFALCAEGLLGQLHGYGRDFTVSQPQYRPWWALGPSVWLGSHLNAPLGWAVRGLALFPLRHDAFGVDGIQGEAYRIPAISFGLEALLRWRIL